MTWANQYFYASDANGPSRTQAPADREQTSGNRPEPQTKKLNSLLRSRIHFFINIVNMILSLSTYIWCIKMFEKQIILMPSRPSISCAHPFESIFIAPCTKKSSGILQSLKFDAEKRRGNLLRKNKRDETVECLLCIAPKFTYGLNFVAVTVYMNLPNPIYEHRNRTWNLIILPDACHVLGPLKLLTSMMTFRAWAFNHIAHTEQKKWIANLAVRLYALWI